MPPGPIILAVAARLVAFVRERWTLAIGLIVPVFIIAGGIASGGLADNFGENAGAIAGTVVQVAGLLTAIAAGAVATRAAGGRCARAT